MKYAISLGVALGAVWFVWSGHTSWWMISLGLVSILFVIFVVFKMRILDSEAVPIWLGIRPMTRYLPWLIKEIVISNLDVSRRIIDPKMPIKPAMIYVPTTQRTSLGRVIFANSITLTPGTVSIELEEGRVHVHALTLEGAEEDLTGEMDRRVSRLEGL